MKIKKLEVMKILANRNWNIKRLSKEVPMDYIYLINILNGKSQPSYIMTIKIANALDIDVENIFEFEIKEA
ncbi:helix-turn-helix domain-containing protein [Staphylococcus warneri]|uniref:helix-turn-helix domain-containing protein n=1 Tax=Staphylococcus warneri TaxID=1292 RepID=UPI001F55CDF0|nr:helix-turn-helix domain-containing protein [Staphylococcus warneri]MCI2789866.1 helix-turn-helix domain-containing protein [Staphylococcus warneri]